ncbi:hypothetical protein PAXINDRAFT_13079 [Paxillus involutus ATCC 200175]|uniref:Uncharacterized protein n=1 Tax=Paxillus involutus ATCC 200175 TaxID=664439 RepID=A0A0C9U4R4_PAXIN|nr:hypothetical protein PAXINDRAFT_13079 [Paxillus involutus ATCC 200175]
MDAPDSVPPSVRLEGEKIRRTSLYVEVDHVETDDAHAKEDEWPPDGEVMGTSMIEKVESRVDPVENTESKSLRRGDELRGREDERVESREVEGKLGEQSKDDGCQQDGRTCDTGGATSGTSHNSKRVGAGPLTEDEANQHRNSKPNVTTGVPRPPTSLPYDTPRPTHIANPPRRHGRLKMQPTKVSQA